MSTDLNRMKGTKDMDYAIYQTNQGYAGRMPETTGFVNIGVLGAPTLNAKDMTPLQEAVDSQNRHNQGLLVQVNRLDAIRDRLRGQIPEAAQGKEPYPPQASGLVHELRSAQNGASGILEALSNRISELTALL